MSEKATGAESKGSAQRSLLDELLAELSKAGGSVSSTEISDVIRKLQSTRDSVKKREDRERARKKKEEAAKKAEEDRIRNENHIKSVTSMDLPTDWENLFAGDHRAEGVHADSIPDGLILSLTNLGRVDIEYISTITGADLKSIILTLKGSIYQNPETWNECFTKAGKLRRNISPVTWCKSGNPQKPQTKNTRAIFQRTWQLLRRFYHRRFLRKIFILLWDLPGSPKKSSTNTFVIF